jgi:hypothetical protein
VVEISDFQAAHKESTNGQMTASTNALKMSCRTLPSGPGFVGKGVKVGLRWAFFASTPSFLSIFLENRPDLSKLKGVLSFIYCI